MHGRIPRGSTLVLLVSSLLALSLPAFTASANPSPGFVEDWSGTSVQGWAGGGNDDNPGSGGFGGAGDGYLRMSTTFPTHLGSVSFGAEYTGNWLAAGVTEVHLWLDDVGAVQPLEMHFSIGSGGTNFWQYNEPFLPSPPGMWIEFVVDLTDASKFTQIFGTGTFSDALQNVDRIHIRHDKSPYVQSPDPIQGEVGVDHLDLRGPTTSARSASWARLKALYR